MVGLLALMAAAAAQEPASFQGFDPDPVQRELQLRELCALPAEQVPVAALQALLRQQEQHQHAVLCLAHHGLLRPEDIWPSDADDEVLGRAALGCQPSAAVRALLADSQAPGHRRRLALETLQDRGELADEDLLRAVLDDDESLSLAALQVLRWERATVPAATLVALRSRHEPRRRWLHLLTVSPRPSLRPWLQECSADDGLPALDRMLALAAVGQDLEPPAARLAMQLLREHGDSHALSAAFRLVCGRIPQAVADGLVGLCHQRCTEGLDPNVLQPLLDRLTVVGERQLLGLMVALDQPVRELLASFLAQRDAPGLRERARAALDGETPLEPYLLLAAGSLLDVPARQQRLLEVVADTGRPEALRLRAYELLLAAGVDDPRLADFADADGNGSRWLQYLGVARRLPARTLDRALAFAGEATYPDGAAPRLERWTAERLRQVRLATFAAMERTGVPPELEALLLQKLQESRRAAPDGTLLRDLEGICRALVVGGSESALQQTWREVRDRAPLSESALEWVSLARRPWAHALLLEELQRPDVPTETLRARIRCALVELGDRRELSRAIADARLLEARWLRRLRTAAPALLLDQAMTLLAAVPAAAGEDVDQAVEMVLWAAGCAEPPVQQALQELWRDSEEPELQEAALRGLLAGPRRAELLAGLDRAALAGPLPGRFETMAFEAVATLPDGDAAEAERAARLYLEQPLRDPAAELARALDFPEGRTGYPMAQTIAHRLRQGGDPGLVAAFGVVAGRLAAAPAVRHLAPQRLLCLWTALAFDPTQQAALGEATAGLLLAIPDPRRTGTEVAAFYAATAALAAGRPAEAEELARTAVRGLLRGDGEEAARIFLGVADSVADRDPRAALAALPFRCRADVHRRAGQEPEAMAALAIAYDLGAADGPTRTSLTALMEQNR